MSKQDIERDVRTEDARIALEELIHQQGITPVRNIDELSDLWPADDDPDLLLRYVLDERAQRRLLPTDPDLQVISYIQ